MDLNSFVQAGGVNAWTLAARGTSEQNLWDVSNNLVGNKWMLMAIAKTWAGFGIVILLMYLMELTRLFLGGKIKDEWRNTIFKLILICTIFVFYREVTDVPNSIADAMMGQIADTEACNEAMFTFVSIAEKGMLATLNPSGASAAITNQSGGNLLQDVSYTLFYIVWWVLPLVMSAFMWVFYILGPYCLAFFLFKPFSGVAAQWARLMVGCYFAYLLLCIAFYLILSSQIFITTATTNALADPFTTIAFSLVGICVAIAMPSFALRLLGGTLSFIPGRQK